MNKPITAKMLPRLVVLPDPIRYQDREVCTHAISHAIKRENTRCQAKAVYQLNGVKLCERHAGRELLIWHLKLIGHSDFRKLG